MFTGKKTPGEPGHTRDTRDTRTHKGTQTTQTNLTTIQTQFQQPYRGYRTTDVLYTRRNFPTGAKLGTGARHGVLKNSELTTERSVCVYSVHVHRELTNYVVSESDRFDPKGV